MAKDEFDDELEGLEEFGDDDFGDFGDDDLGDLGEDNSGGDDLGTEDIADDDLGDEDFGDLGDDDLGDEDFGDLGDDDLGDEDFGDLGDDDLGDEDFGDLGDDDREGLDDDPFGDDESDEGDPFAGLGELGEEDEYGIEGEEETEEKSKERTPIGLASQKMGRLVEMTQQRKPFYVLALITLLIGASLGGGALWLVYENPEETASLMDKLPVNEMQKQMETFQESAEKEFSDLTGMAHTANTEIAESVETSRAEAKKVKPAPPPRIKKHAYYVRVAQCIYQECVNDYRLLLKQHRVYSKIVATTENTPVFEVVSRSRFSDFRAASWVKRINQNYRLTGQAFRKNEGERYRVSMGLFPNQQTAHHLKSQLNLIFAGQLAFEIKSVQQKTLYYQIRTKSFDSKQHAAALHNQLMDQNEKFKEAELITQTYYL
ncbi:MAG: hypothetical protein HQM14_17930 [SAR324 cluster bacterium]|nr:hypothetical protein [SAR324 cluster bacterium]